MVEYKYFYRAGTYKVDYIFNIYRVSSHGVEIFLPVNQTWSDLSERYKTKTDLTTISLSSSREKVIYSQNYDSLYDLIDDILINDTLGLNKKNNLLSLL